ncbi:MAG: sigma-54 dependent transcriptional regulator [Muribaculaceae bacterium]|jgi:DNA-binding NtrC family response regulator
MDETRIQQAKARLGIIGNAPALAKAVGRALRVAPIDLSVLVTGESGAGKEFFPAIIHQYSPRKHAKYIAVNCGAIPEGTIDSELFGHEKGAFTGAVSSRKGYFEEANGGTIFLDEVAELPLTTQARLLRVLETGEYIKVGSSEVQKTDIRVVAATNVDMARAVAEGRFREDLFYRLATVSITVPPLRERGNDIQLLARKFASDFAEKNRTPQISFSDGARDRMLAYRWPGNVRQLKNVVEQMALFEAGNEISPETLAGYLPEATATLMPVLHQSRNLPATTGRGDGDHTYEREREMLFSLIFKMREEIEQLRADVDELKGEKPSQPASSLVKLRPAIIDTPVEIMDAKAEEMPPHDAGLAAATQAGLPEKEVIRLSLQRNSGRRKAAAMELNISERTLYRKIKEYGLE